jgi:Ca2+-binding EF-hand superfamily protein
MVGLDLSQADISDMVFEADREGQGQVYEDDFRRVMRERGSLPVDESDSD